MVGITDVVPKVSGAGIINGILVFVACLLAVTIIGYFTWWFIKKKKYSQFKIVIWEKDSTGNTHEYYDRAGVFLDKKTGYKLLFLEKLKKGLNPNNVPYVTSKDKKGRLIKTVYLKKIGVSNYVFCKMSIDNDELSIKVGEEDVNWAAQEIETIKRQYNKEGWLTKFAPYIMFIVTILIIMIVLISLFNKFSVIKDASDNLLLVAKEQRATTEIMLNLTRAPVINQGQPIIVPGGQG